MQNGALGVALGLLGIEPGHTLLEDVATRVSLAGVDEPLRHRRPTRSGFAAQDGRWDPRSRLLAR